MDTDRLTIDQFPRNRCPSRNELLEQAFDAIMKLTPDERREVLAKHIAMRKEAI